MNYVSINGATIRKNAVAGTDEPPIRIAKSRSDKKPTYAHEIVISGPCRLIYDAKARILACGARLAIETAGEVEIVR